MKALNSEHLRVFKNLSAIERCPLLWGNLKKTVTFGTNCFVMLFKACSLFRMSLYFIIFDSFEALFFCNCLKARIHCETFLSEYFMKYSFRGISWNIKYAHEIGKSTYDNMFSELPLSDKFRPYLRINATSYYWSCTDFYTFITYAFYITNTYDCETCIHYFIIYWFLKFTTVHVFHFYK